MQYRPLGRTGVQVSPLCLGVMNFPSKATADDGYAIIDAAIAAGINFIDTANVYSRGQSETVTGEALKRNGKRDFVVLATKVHGKMDDHDPNMFGNSRRHIIQQCDASLRRLQTDYIDLYQIHRPQPSVPIDETLRALDDLIRSGKVRYVGTSTFAAWQVVQALWIAKELGTHRFICEQPPYNLLDRRIESELLPVCRTYGIGVIPWSPIAGGLLSGKYQFDAPPPPGSRFSEKDKHPHLARRYTQACFNAVGQYAALAEKKSVSLSQLALAWCVQQPDITSPIIGPRTLDQLTDNLAALDVPITDADRATIDQIVPPKQMASPFYDADFTATPLRW